MPDDTKQDKTNPYDMLLAKFEELKKELATQNTELEALKKSNEEMAKFNRSLLNQRQSTTHSESESNAKAKLEKYLNE